MNRNSIALFALSFFLIIFSACKENSGQTQSGKSAGDLPTLSQEEQDQYMESGKTIAKATFMALSSNLQKALKEGGVAEAAEYCNIVAMPLTDSLSQVHNAQIKRTSQKLRNPENKPTEDELNTMYRYQDQLASSGAPLKPVVKAIDDQTVKFYAPIITQQLCLTCHGTIGEELTQENYSILKDLYPEDQATGYGEKELRGIWSITFDKSKT